VSKSTDKLNVLRQIASDTLRQDPKALEKIKSIELTWTDYSEITVPNVRIEFHEPKAVKE
jgi:hypothetical protein